MLDVHVPHGKMIGVKDFFLHLLTIVIGLLIALGLEGWVEYEHHRHVAHQAEDGLRAEIANNAHLVGPIRQQIKDHQKELEANQKFLAEMRAHRHATGSRITLGSGKFDDISWKTAQNTGAIAYMSYKDAQTFSNIYLEQDEFLRVGRLSTEDTLNCASLFNSHPDDWVPSPAQNDIITDRMGKAQQDLMLLVAIVNELDERYQKFESEHK